jgi:hypothetical protein
MIYPRVIHFGKKETVPTNGEGFMFRFVRCPCSCRSVFLIGDDVKKWKCPVSGQVIRFSSKQLAESRLSDEDWISWTEPREILPYLHLHSSARKLRLLYCAFSRIIWDQLAPEHRRVVETAECLADGLVSPTKWEEVSRQSGFRERVSYPGFCTLWTEGVETSLAMQYVRNVLWPKARMYCQGTLTLAERKVQCDAIREIFGQFHWNVKILPTWLQWNEGICVTLAKVIRRQGRFENMPILADALEEAGCNNPAILNHCRQTADHVRGCWVLDLILGKK